MNRYYLMAQLPSLEAISDNAPLPITEERFTELCERFLGKRASAALGELTLVPSRSLEKSGISLIDTYNDFERRLRIALACVRAELLHKQFEPGEQVPSTQLLQSARSAVGMKDPLEAERYLNSLRLGFLEALRPADMFSEASVYYYGLKLKLLSRMRRFDTEKGRLAYRNKYSSIMSGGEEVNE